ncbi:BspA family leucine-rich repeat surface protein [Flagellimonas pelagia]|uniref:BspA family leucine-rich repeat surface protein n=1 Tax=Flagellimonas pelagia TaxID=2306998 RepID=A0A3A1NHD9_9FLAO|nr:BspA family leucine-rich repeat surface protein [Allomuricauda maritima]RIV43142.1 BspA family leucine-rich repeat surface protein [Allomuricauda maritima]TXJ92344.1 BspA family leucine-rich repeat surface protein [Allomuricauda maritima]
MRIRLFPSKFVFNCNTFLILFFICTSGLKSQISNSDFVTTWKTDNQGGTNNTSVLIPTTGTGYNYDVDWDNDGTFDDFGITGDAAHDYGTTGTYTIRIRGSFPRIYIKDNNSAKDKIISVEQWGDIQWTSMSGAFQGAVNLVINATDIPDLSSVNDMSFMFRDAASFNQDISNWDVGNVTNMQYLFSNAVRFNQPLADWNVENVVNMRYMFSNASSFNQNINNWNVANVTNMEGMFGFDDPTDPFDLIQPDDIGFNQPLNDWNVGQVTNMKKMFLGAINFNLPLGDWNVSNVTNMEEMFRDADSFDQPLDSWDVGNVTNMRYMFSASPGPVFGGGPDYNFNQPLNSWNVSSVVTMYGMFAFTDKFDQPLNNWDVSNVTTLAFMFQEADAFDQPLNDWDVSSVTDLGGMFQGTAKFNQPLHGWNVGNVTLMDGLFDRAVSFNQSLESWNISSVTDMLNIFNGIKLSTDNYDRTLISWSTQTLQAGVEFNGGNSNYCEGEAGRATLINMFGWNIIDAGLDCSVFTLPYNNFIIETISETCSGSNNAQIIVNVLESMDYVANINDENYSFTSELLIEDLAPGDYSLCISVPSEAYEQCFALTLQAGTELSGKSNVEEGKTAVQISQGTAPYSVFVNGSELLKTRSKEFVLDADAMDLIEIKSSIPCEGTFRIENPYLITQVYPNPTKGALNIVLGENNVSLIELFSNQGL